MKLHLEFGIMLAALVCLPFSGLLNAADTTAEAARLYQQGIESANQEHYEDAVRDLTQAQKLLPEKKEIRQALAAILGNWGAKLFEEHKIDDAEKCLREAIRWDARHGPAWFQLGDIAYLYRNDFKSALEFWKKALPLAPSSVRPQILNRISRTELDSRLERGYQKMETAHFEIRFEQSFPVLQAERIGNYLENEYEKLAEMLQVDPAKITLVIYPENSFDRLIGGHEGTLGLYDGRIRIGAREVGSRHEKMILSHELAHAFLQQAFGSNLPIWIQEGFAQTREPEKELTAEQTQVDSQLADGNGWVPLKWLDRKFAQPLHGEDITRAYLQSYRVVSYLLDTGSKGAFWRFLGLIQGGKGVREAFEAAYPGGSWNAVEHGRLERDNRALSS